MSQIFYSHSTTPLRLDLPICFYRVMLIFKSTILFILLKRIVLFLDTNEVSLGEK
jgi:hypothetical protein